MKLLDSLNNKYCSVTNQLYTVTYSRLKRYLCTGSPNFCSPALWYLCTGSQNFCSPALSLRPQLDNGGGNSHPCPPLDCLKRWQSDYTYHRPHRVNELATESEKWNGKPRLNVSTVDIHLRKLLWVYCPGHVGVKGNDRADRLAGKATFTSGLLRNTIKPAI